ncbi:MAG TPA: SOS response-associated peptidase family protein, partial [Acidimicrobiales bacterium]|nr:SOS response-associated peptidase family protein [Acidimicrobiales bacterium]
MCGRIALYSEPDFLARVFDAVLGLDVEPHGRPSWNIGPMRSVLAVADVGGSPDPGERDGAPVGVHRELGRYRWGLVP